MKRLCFFIVVALCFVAVPLISAQEREYFKRYDSDALKAEEPLDPGMERIEVDKIKMVVPKGAHIKKEDGVVSVETTTRYMARRFEEMEGRLVSLEKELAALKEKEERMDSLEQSLEALKEEVNQLKATRNDE